MTDLGSIGFDNQTVPDVAYLTGPPRWWNPYNHAIVYQNDTTQGPVPDSAGFLNGRVPAPFIPIVVSDYGGVGGGIWLT